MKTVIENRSFLSFASGRGIGEVFGSMQPGNHFSSEALME